MDMLAFSTYAINALANIINATTARIGTPTRMLKEKIVT